MQAGLSVQFVYLACVASIGFGFQPQGSAAETVDYTQSIKPIFSRHCLACHGPWKQQGGLRLDTGAAIRRGGESGPGVIPGDSAASLLMGATTGSAGFRMPPDGEGTPLSAAEIATLRDWIDQGAPSPEGEQPAADPRSFWSYQPVVRPALAPLLPNASWCRSPIDALIAEKHVELELSPRPEASPEVLLRRVFLDLIGLPPTPDELQAFLADDRPDALHRVVDGLLASPLYGQRWGRHWMDVWRYSDWYGSRGINEIRYGQRHLWRWRDWIVDSLNADRGYDDMLIAMLAGDESAPGDLDTACATGFLGRNWYKFDRNVWLFETVEQTSQAFLGLTLKCARCHDHKFDPITQQDYYRFRAFFEPHDVRTDPLSSRLDTEKDATLGPVLKEGVSFVYDKRLAEPTYVFRRGDSRSPMLDEPLEPGVPAAFPQAPLVIRPVVLPQSVVAPYLQPSVVAGQLQQADTAEQEAQRQLEAAIRAHKLATDSRDQFANGSPRSRPEPIFVETFQQPNPQVWQPHGGKWEFQSGHLVQAEPGHFPTLLANVVLPVDFAARLRYRTLEAGTIHSVGIFFDVGDLRDCQAIYTAIKESQATVQAFHRQQGKEEYPPAGIFPCQLQLLEPVTMDFAVRGPNLNVWVNGKLVLAYVMPVPRRSGSLAIWTHAAAAEFHEIRVEPLPPDFSLASHVSAQSLSPLEAPTLAELERRVQFVQQGLSVAERQLEVVRKERIALASRIAADRARVAATPDADPLARVASLAEKQAAICARELAVLQAEQTLQRARAVPVAEGQPARSAESDAEKQLAKARADLEAARKRLETNHAEYTSLGEMYPSTSTGRRLALARWIASAENPRTSRVAANHIWLRHFGEAIVPSVANFGLNGQLPSHPSLLDYLAAELVTGEWSMKALHRQLVTSAAYRLASTEGEAHSSNVARDPTNRWLWRMNSRRLEAELVRDCVLGVCHELDVSLGGPELAESSGLESRRRSLYFRCTPNEKMPFLESFDQANPNECYRRQESVVPQQSLALMNSSLALSSARSLAAQVLKRRPLDAPLEKSDEFITEVFLVVLSRRPTPPELAACRDFLQRQFQLFQGGPQHEFPAANAGVRPAAERPWGRAAENLILVLLNHNDFVTIR